MSKSFTVDQSALSVVVVCHRCSWRVIRPTSPAGWTVAAIHAKAVHGDMSVVARAREAARSARRRRVAKRPSESGG